MITENSKQPSDNTQKKKRHKNCDDTTIADSYLVYTRSGFSENFPKHLQT